MQWTHSSGTAGTINHGLSEAPTFIIYKSSANDTRWTVGHDSLGWTRGLVLDTNSAQLAADAAYWNNTAPTSSVFSIGDTGQIGNGNTLAYCWHDVPGLQKFGSYVGDGSSDNPLHRIRIPTAVVWVKIYSGTDSNWVILDKERDPDNVVQNNLYADDDAAQNQFNWADFLNNGFKPRVDLNQINGNSYKYIYCAWAEAPSVDLYGGGANAR